MKISKLKLSKLLICFAAPALAAATQSARSVEYKEKIINFETWLEKAPNEVEALNLFPEFKEPLVEYIDSGAKKSRLQKMVMYITRTKTLADRQASKVNLPALISEEAFKKFDQKAIHKRITAAEIMPNVVGKGEISNFKWCNKNPANPDIFLPSLEISQSHMNRKDRAWCPADSRTACYETCRLADTGSAIQAAIMLWNAAKSPGKDFGVATQSEMRYYTSEAEYGAKIPLAKMTNEETPVTGVVEINFFYFNQVMVFGKLIVILQPSTKDPQKTVVTSFNAFGVREHDWNHARGGAQVRDLLRSKTVMNAKSGILAGIPTFTKTVAQGIAEMIEKK